MKVRTISLVACLSYNNHNHVTRKTGLSIHTKNLTTPKISNLRLGRPIGRSGESRETGNRKTSEQVDNEMNIDNPLKVKYPAETESFI